VGLFWDMSSLRPLVLEEEPATQQTTAQVIDFQEPTSSSSSPQTASAFDRQSSTMDILYAHIASKHNGVAIITYGMKEQLADMFVDRIAFTRARIADEQQDVEDLNTLYIEPDLDDARKEEIEEKLIQYQKRIVQHVWRFSVYQDAVMRGIPFIRSYHPLDDQAICEQSMTFLGEEKPVCDVLATAYGNMVLLSDEITTVRRSFQVGPLGQGGSPDKEDV